MARGNASFLRLETAPTSRRYKRTLSARIYPFCKSPFHYLTIIEINLHSRATAEYCHNSSKFSIFITITKVMPDYRTKWPCCQCKHLNEYKTPQQCEKCPHSHCNDCGKKAMEPAPSTSNEGTSQNDGATACEDFQTLFKVQPVSE